MGTASDPGGTIEKMSTIPQRGAPCNAGTYCRHRHSLGHKVGFSQAQRAAAQPYRAHKKALPELWQGVISASAKSACPPDCTTSHPRRLWQRSCASTKNADSSCGVVLAALGVGAARYAPAPDRASPVRRHSSSVQRRASSRSSAGSQARRASTWVRVLEALRVFTAQRSVSVLPYCATMPPQAPSLADRTFHLQFDQAVHFHSIFHGQFLTSGSMKPLTIMVTPLSPTARAHQ